MLWALTVVTKSRKKGAVWSQVTPLSTAVLTLGHQEVCRHLPEVISK